MTNLLTRRERRRRLGLALVAVCVVAAALIASACSALLNSDTSQCSKDSDCSQFGAGARCNTASAVCIGGPDTGVDGGDGSMNQHDADAASGRDGCIDPNGFGGAGCYACGIGPDSSSEQILNACTNYPIAFVPFDNTARITGFDPNNPRPPLPEAGVVDSGPDATPDAGSDSGDAGDAGPVCNASTCPNGCCNGSTCMALSDTACGTGGSVCVACSGGTPTCANGGTCKATCPAIPSLQNPVIFVGSTGLPVQDTIDSMGAVSDAGINTVSIVFLTVGSCDGVNTMTTSGLRVNPRDPVLIFQPSTSNPPPPPVDCAVKPNDGPYPADIGAGGLFWDTCNPGLVQPTDFADFIGPVNPVGFIVPHGSTQTSISGEAAYKVYGFGSNSGVTPWTDNTHIWRRNPTSGNQTCVSRTLGLDIASFQGNDSHGGANIVSIVGSMIGTDSERTIGLSSSEVVDPARGTVSNMAYRHFGQNVGFYWDADPNSYDRRPIRDGHSFMWLLIHVFGHIDQSGAIVGATGNRGTLDVTPGRRPGLMGDLVDFLTLRRALPDGRDVITSLKSPTGGAAAIPSCAMHVKRTTDSGPLVFYSPPQPCDCAWEEATPSSSNPDCHKCTGSSDCASIPGRPLCSFGYCEPSPQ